MRGVAARGYLLSIGDPTPVTCSDSREGQPASPQIVRKTSVSDRGYPTVVNGVCAGQPAPWADSPQASGPQPVNIRKFVLRAVRLEELVDLGSPTPPAARFLHASVTAGLNILVSGGTQAPGTRQVAHASLATTGR
jgi:hypothetical protein